MKNNKTAILIFANSAEFEATQKPFQSSEALFDALNRHTVEIVEKSGLPYFLSSEKNQIGSSFGERFTNAIQSVYNKGYENVVTIGNDTPHLQTNHILKAVHQLQQNDIVLGPSKDGGFYLMGLKKSHFNVETFLKLPWQTSALSRNISRLTSSQNINLSYLETLSDIDTILDAKTIIDSFRSISKYIKQLLQQYISVEKKIISSLFSSIETSTQTLLFNKGSPLFIHI
ncbi:TIGR04282 family arsenosugar biosynthesis glycosyltransferase [Psychroserpens luteus]|uniref:DUF2064 domain-containing protein n=1 Tax=Psychroserpens luteus TaxID=1434066 RepID=A0ABW5ZVT1_9FLAO|nr:DUF2064 domain-containing protein [Psychroserpens luteus]